MISHSPHNPRQLHRALLELLDCTEPHHLSSTIRDLVLEYLITRKHEITPQMQSRLEELLVLFKFLDKLSEHTNPKENSRHVTPS